MLELLKNKLKIQQSLHKVMEDVLLKLDLEIGFNPNPSGNKTN